ncbi:MAG TPA: methyltransferase [Bacillota bacterium]|nr:methyltransferase [Bacillota bacterium]
MKETQINGSLRLREDTSGLLFGTDALLLSAFCPAGSKKTVVDIGSGSGVVGLLMLRCGKAGRITGIEIQQKYAELSLENARINGYEDKYECINANVRDFKSFAGCAFADCVVTNPPYMASASGKLNAQTEKYIARHETECTIDDICEAASYMLRFGGSFYAVYRPERLAGLFYAMKSNAIEPKVLLPVCPCAGDRPSLVLVEGRRAGAPGLSYCKPLVIYCDTEHLHYTAEMETAVKEGKISVRK